MLLGFLFNVSQFIKCDGNISEAGGIYETSLVLAHHLYGLQLLIVTFIPLLVCLYIIDPIYNERNLQCILYTKISPRKFYATRLISIFLLSFILCFSFYSTLILCNHIIFGVKYLGTDAFARYLTTDYFTFIEGRIYNFFILPYSLLKHPTLVALTYGVLTSFYGSAMSIFTYGLSFVIKKYILIYIIPFVVPFAYRMIFTSTFLFDFSIECILVSYYRSPYPYSWIGYFCWFFLLILFGVVFIKLSTKNGKEV